jgi:hypothetical protein
MQNPQIEDPAGIPAGLPDANNRKHGHLGSCRYKSPSAQQFAADSPSCVRVSTLAATLQALYAIPDGILSLSMVILV